LQLEGKDVAELIEALDDGFINLEVFDTAIVETKRTVDRYAARSDLKKDAIRKVVEGASSEHWMPQLLEAVLNSGRTQSNEDLRGLIKQLLKKYTSGSQTILKRHWLSNRLVKPTPASANGCLMS
jgi:hypothetical protein